MCLKTALNFAAITFLHQNAPAVNGRPLGVQCRDLYGEMYNFICKCVSMFHPLCFALPAIALIILAWRYEKDRAVICRSLFPKGFSFFGVCIMRPTPLCLYPFCTTPRETTALYKSFTMETVESAHGERASHMARLVTSNSSYAVEDVTR